MNYLTITFRDFIKEQLNEAATTKEPTKTNDINPVNQRKAFWEEMVIKFNEVLEDYDDLQK